MITKHRIPDARIELDCNARMSPSCLAAEEPVAGKFVFPPRSGGF